MVNEEILGGLKTALARKQSLRQAMISFLNAGYDRNDIEEAARALSVEKYTKPVEGKSQQIVTPIKPPLKSNKPSKSKKIVQKTPLKVVKSRSLFPPQAPQPQQSQQIQEPAQINQPILRKEEKQIKKLKKKQKQIASGYEKYKSKRRTITIALISILLALIGVLVLVLTFKDEIISFFNSLF